MLELLNKKYEELKACIKNNNVSENCDELNDKIITLYCLIIGYYSAKLDLNINTDSTEKLKDRINLESYDKKLVEKLNLGNHIDHFVNSGLESRRAEFYDTLHFLKVYNSFFDNTIDKLKNDFDEGYLKAVLDRNQKKLNSRNQNRIYKSHEKSYKLISKHIKK